MIKISLEFEDAHEAADMMRKIAGKKKAPDKPAAAPQPAAPVPAAVAVATAAAPAPAPVAPAAVITEADVQDLPFAAEINALAAAGHAVTLKAMLTSAGVNKGSELNIAQRIAFLSQARALVLPA